MVRRVAVECLHLPVYAGSYKKLAANFSGPQKGLLRAVQCIDHWMEAAFQLVPILSEDEPDYAAAKAILRRTPLFADYFTAHAFRVLILVRVALGLPGPTEEVYHLIFLDMNVCPQHILDLCRDGEDAADENWRFMMTALNCDFGNLVYLCCETGQLLRQIQRWQGMTEDEAMDYLLELLSGVGDEVQDIADNYGRFSSLHEKFRDVLPGYDFAHTYKLRTSYVFGALEMLKLLLWSHDTVRAYDF